MSTYNVGWLKDNENQIFIPFTYAKSVKINDETNDTLDNTVNTVKEHASNLKDQGDKITSIGDRVTALENGTKPAGKTIGTLTIGSKHFNGSKDMTVVAKDLGLTGALVYLGISTKEIKDGKYILPTINGKDLEPSDLNPGNVVLYNNGTTYQEFVWTGDAWELLGDEGSYALKTLGIIAGEGILINNGTSGNLTSDVNIAINTDEGLTITFTDNKQLTLAKAAKNTGIFGQSDNSTVTPSGTKQFYIPQVEVDAYGRVISISTKTVTLAQDDNLAGDIHNLDNKIKNITDNIQGTIQPTDENYLDWNINPRINTLEARTQYIDGTADNTFNITDESGNVGFRVNNIGNVQATGTIQATDFFINTTSVKEELNSLHQKDNEFSSDIQVLSNKKINTGNGLTGGDIIDNNPTLSVKVATNGGITVNSEGIALEPTDVHEEDTSQKYGQDSDEKLEFKGEFNVPYIEVDKYGRVTAADTITITLPNVDDINTQLGINTQNIGNNAKNIATNTQNIGNNAKNIATNTQNIGNNTKNIENNIKNIATNTKDITELKNADNTISAEINKLNPRVTALEARTQYMNASVDEDNFYITDAAGDVGFVVYGDSGNAQVVGQMKATDFIIDTDSVKTKLNSLTQKNATLENEIQTLNAKEIKAGNGLTGGGKIHENPTLSVQVVDNGGISVDKNGIKLSESGVTSGSYGQNTDEAPNFAESFEIPYIEVDNYGRITSADSITITLPNAPDHGQMEAQIHKNTTDIANNANNINLNSGRITTLEARTQYMNASVDEDNFYVTDINGNVGFVVYGDNDNKGNVRAIGQMQATDFVTNDGNSVNTNASNIATKVDKTTTINAGSGLTGGGSLSSNLTLSLASVSTLTVGSYGPSSNYTPSFGTSFTVPQFNVDKYGRITSAFNRAIKLPSADNNKVTQTETSSADNHPLLATLSSSASVSSETNAATVYNKNITITPNTGAINANIFNGTTFNGDVFNGGLNTNGKNIQLTKNVNYGTAISSTEEGILVFEEVNGYLVPEDSTHGQVLMSDQGMPKWKENIASAIQINPIETDRIYVTGTFDAQHLYYNNNVYIEDNVLMGAAWNDYAEYRICKDNYKPGQVVCENGDDTLSISKERLQPGAELVSDTFGFAIGQTAEATCPIAVSGRVLAYTYEPREEFKAGDAVCAGPNGTVSKMTREEIREYPERIIGTVSAIPNYETWNDKVIVNNRIWIKIK